MATRRKGKIYSRKKMREINMLKSWRRFVGGRERWVAKILRKKIRV